MNAELSHFTVAYYRYWMELLPFPISPLQEFAKSHAKILKCVADIFSSSLAALNNFFKTKVLPKSLEAAKIVPVNKRVNIKLF